VTEQLVVVNRGNGQITPAELFSLSCLVFKQVVLTGLESEPRVRSENQEPG